MGRRLSSTSSPSAITRTSSWFSRVTSASVTASIPESEGDTIYLARAGLSGVLGAANTFTNPGSCPSMLGC